MSRAMAMIAFTVLWANHAWAAPSRIWFSLTGVDEGQPIDGTPPEYYAQVNPQVDASVGTVRLYIWGTLGGAYYNYHTASLDVNVYPQAGSVVLVASDFYNFNSPLYPAVWRWWILEQGNLSEHKLDDAWMQGEPFGWGWSYLAEVAGDAQYDPQTLSMLLGYVDLEMSPDAQGQIFFGVGEFGFSYDAPGGSIYFGWGDPAINQDQPPYGQESQLADAVIVPEPATLLLLLIPLALVRRR
jgi:hypothetical protein